MLCLYMIYVEFTSDNAMISETRSHFVSIAMSIHQNLQHKMNATRQVAYFFSPYFRRIIIHTLETKFVYSREFFQRETLQIYLRSLDGFMP